MDVQVTEEMNIELLCPFAKLDVEDALRRYIMSRQHGYMGCQY